MSSQSDLGTRSKRLFAYVITVVACGILLVSCGKGQQNVLPAQTATLTVTITANDPNNPVPTYTTVWSSPNTPADSRCNFVAGDPPDGPRIHRVCLGDTIQWAAVTAKDSSGTMKSTMMVVHEDAVMDRNGAPTKSFLGQDGHPDGGSVDRNAMRDQSHEYYVVIVDRVGRQVYVDDPSIVIGTGGH